MKSIVLYAGGIGSGKTYCLNKFIESKKSTGNSIFLVSFADPIKKIVEIIYGVDKNGNILFNQDCIYVEEQLSQFLDCLAEYKIYEKSKENRKKCIPWFEEINKKFIMMKNGELDSKSFVRYALQILGTEIGQCLISKTIWVDILIKKIQKIESDYIIIDDWRFLFELLHLQLELSDTVIEPYFILASEEVRAKRKNITVEKLREMSQHFSEIESENVIKPYMNIYFPNNFITNEE